VEALEVRTLLSGSALSPGSLDPTFGNNGVVLAESTAPLNAVPAAAVQLSNGDIVVAGTGSGNFIMAAYKPDGSGLDTSFGTKGEVILDSFAAQQITGITVQTDGKILVAGDTPAAAGTNEGFALARFNSNGTLDNTFGNNGTVVTNFSGLSAAATGVTVESDGKVIVVGTTSGGAAPGLAVARYTSTGALDNSFGTSGEVTTTVATGNAEHSAQVAVQNSDDKVVIAGSALVRLNADGSLDTTFGNKGDVTLDFDPSYLTLDQTNGTIELAGAKSAGSGTVQYVFADFDATGALQNEVLTTPADSGSIGGAGFAFAFQSDGKLLVLNKGANKLERYNTDGTLDTNFGTSGNVGINESSSDPQQLIGLLVQTGDKPLVFGGITSTDSSPSSFALWSYNPDGTPDTTFGSNADGQVTTVFQGNIDSAAGVAAVQKDGKVVVATASATTGTSIPILTRYDAKGNLDKTFGQDGQVIDTTATGKATAIAIRASDGEIFVLAGNLTAYTADGQLDTAFGTNGRIMPSNSNGVETTFALQSNGDILLATSNGFGDWILQRFDTKGNLDSKFGTKGQIATPGPISNLVVESDGTIIAAQDPVSTASLFTPARVPNLSAALIAYNPDGTVDTAFGHNGVVTLTSKVNSLALDNGQLLVAGMTLQRFNPDGSLDTNFGMLGQIPIDASSIAVEPNGDIVVLSGSTMMVYKSTGNLELSFGTNGQMAADFGSGTTTVNGITLDTSNTNNPQNIYVVGGSANNNGHSSSAVARYLIGGTATLSNNQLYVTQLYFDLLHRAPDAAGLASFVADLDNGMSRSQVAQAFTSSSEYHALEVENVYRTVLGRAADPSGLSTYTKFLDQGGTIAQVEAILLGSDEFFSKHSQTNMGFLSGVYQIVLDRAIDDSGELTWLQALNQGTSRQAVAASILASPESDVGVVNMTYARYLHRAADSGGRDGWVNALEKGLTQEQLVMNFVSVDEYFTGAVQLPQGTTQPSQSSSQQS
jgi:uncharacterized delta-60 repeat protein